MSFVFGQPVFDSGDPPGLGYTNCSDKVGLVPMLEMPLVQSALPLSARNRKLRFGYVIEQSPLNHNI